MTTSSDAPLLLANGQPADVRVMTAADRPAVSSLFATTSPTNPYTRFFTMGRGVVDSHMHHLFGSLDDPNVRILESDDRLLGLADVERVETVTSEVAFLVADEAHGLGVASLLLERVADEARDDGVQWLVADVLAVHHPMLTVFADAGFRIVLTAGHGDVVVRLSTERTPAVVAASRSRRDRAEQARRLRAAAATA